MQVRGPQRGVWAFNAPARLAPGWTVEGAREDLRAVAIAAYAEVSELEPGTTLTAVPLREVFIGDEGRTLVVLLAAVGFFLLIVCANLANLLLARALGRGREFALRAAVGASRARLLRQLLVESVVLTLIGGALGLALSALAIRMLGNADFIPYAQLSLNFRVFLYGLAFALAFGILSGAYPAWRMSRLHPVEALHGRAK